MSAFLTTTELCESRLFEALGEELALNTKKYWASNQFEKALHELAKLEKLIHVRKWAEFYNRVMNVQLKIDIDEIPDKREDFDRLLVLGEGITVTDIWNKLTERLNCWSVWDDFREIQSVRRLGHTYFVWVKEKIEADEQHKNKSAEHIKREGINAITLEERLILELFHNCETRIHLDSDTVTLCAGSQDPNGNIPSVYWNGDTFCVYLYAPTNADPKIRVREVVSLSKM